MVAARGAAPYGQEEGDGDRLRGVHLLSHDPAFLGVLPRDNPLMPPWQVLGGWEMWGFVWLVFGCLFWVGAWLPLQEQVKEGIVIVAVGNQPRPLPRQPNNKQNPNSNHASGTACGLQAAL